MSGNSPCENLLPFQEMAEVDVEGCELVLLEDLDLLDVVEFGLVVRSLRHGSGGFGESDVFREPVEAIW